MIGLVEHHPGLRCPPDHQTLAEPSAIDFGWEMRSRERVRIPPCEKEKHRLKSIPFEIGYVGSQEGLPKRICLFLVHEPGCRGNNYYCIYHRIIAKVGFRVESSELDPENAIKISEDITRFIEVLIFQTAVRKLQKSCCIQLYKLYNYGIPSRELTYPLPRHFWRWVSFSPGGIC